MGDSARETIRTGPGSQVCSLGKGGKDTMAIYLVQHGKSLPKDADPEQGLSQEGIAEVERIAAVAKGYNIGVRKIRHSPKRRARQTAEILQAAIAPEGPLEVMEGLKPLDDVSALEADALCEGQVMLVGHLPFMERLSAYLITGSIQKRVFKFQNGGIVCLDREQATGDWFIKWALMPHIT